MEPFDLPPELSEVERRIAERQTPQLSAAFRERVLAAMRTERTPRRTAWKLVASVAASVLVILNLALSVANHRAWSESQRIELEGIEATVRTLRQRHPDLSERQAYQFALLLHSPPALPLSLPSLLPLEGEQSWDML
jgi:hypothetical protein